MPQYLAPGTYIEEVSFRSKSIEGESTTMTGFIGPTRYGPIDLPNQLLISVGEFEHSYGDQNQLEFGTAFLHNYVWHAARAFFAEGGKQLYVSRIFRRLDSANPSAPLGGTVDATPGMTGQLFNDGHARARLWPNAPANTSLRVRSRWPGTYGNLRVRLSLQVGKNVLAFDKVAVGLAMVDMPRVSALGDRDVVLIRRGISPVSADFYIANFDVNTQRFTFQPQTGPTLDTTGSGANSLARGDRVQVISVNVAISPSDSDVVGLLGVWEGLALDKDHETNGAADALTYVFASHVESPSLEREHGRDKPVVIVAESQVNNGLGVLNALFTASPGQVHSPPAPTDQQSLREKVLDDTLGDADRWLEVVLAGGNDGLLISATEYEGSADPASTAKTGLKQFEDLENLSIIAAPGSTFNFLTDPDRADTIINLVIGHCERMRYRIAVIDSGNDLSISEVQDMRARFDSSWGAMYYPWVRVLDPVTRVPIFLPPSGFVSGIYARNDINRAVYKVPANEVVTLSIGFENLLNKAQQDVLNPLGVNCFRFFEGRGYRLWGGRTMSSDPEWKYVNLRRYFAYLEHSIDHGTQWAVFEPNGPQLWANMRQTIADFLLNEFFSGALLGDRPEQAYFVRCDRSTMTQNDLDNGRLVVLIGVAVVKPAEFVIFRIGQWTADRK
jgi:phage tail sheath protein FI